MSDDYMLARSQPQPPLGADEIARRVRREREVGPVLDPLDDWPEPVLVRFWVQEGHRLTEREQAMAELASVRGWRFAAFDAALSAQVYDSNVTADVPRVARNVCRDDAGGSVVCDLTGIVVDVDSDPTFAHDLRVRAAGAAMVPFHGREGHRIVVQPAHSESTTWQRFGPGVPTESLEFDDAFRVHARDAAWALLLLNPSVMDRLLASRPVTLVVSGGYLALVRPGLVPTADLLRLYDAATHIALSASAAAWHP